MTSSPIVPVSTAVPAQTATALKSITVKLKDLDIAPENPRFLEGPDELIPDLATSLAPDAAGLLVPLLVRPGGKKEKPFMALDGRRRLFGFHHLLAAGLVTEDLETPAYLCETKEAIAAAAITANQARLPLKPAEIILAIRALAAKKITVEAMARALCVDLAEARKYHAVSQVHMDVLLAFKDKLFEFSVLKLIARVPSQAEQKKLAVAARANGRLWPGHVEHYLEQGVLSAECPVMTFVGMDAYRAAGGKLSADLLGELPDSCTDAALAYRLWSEKVEPLKARGEAAGVTVFVSADEDADLPDGYCALPYRYNRTKDEQARINAAKAACDAVEADHEEALARGDDQAWQALFSARLELAQATAAPMAVRAALLRPDDREPVRVGVYTTDADVAAWRAEMTSEPSAYTPEPSRTPDPMPERKVVVDTSDRGHAFHRSATEVLVRGFRRALSDSFVAALKLQVASQFEQIVLVQPFGIGDDKALQISCVKNVQSRSYAPMDGLDKDLVDRLVAYRDQYVASGLRPYAWVTSLGFPQIQDLLALMTAANVWIEEDRTDRIKSRARAQIQEVADELDFDLRAYWYPDSTFYARGSKKQLLRYASQMGCDLEEIVSLKKGALADFVAEQGVLRQWQPPALSFANDIAEADLADDDEDAGGDTIASDDAQADGADADEEQPPAIAAE